MPPSAGASQRGGIRLGCVIVAVVLLGILFVLFLPTMWCLFDHAPTAACRHNLKMIGTACQNWASTHRQQWPDVFNVNSTHWNDIGNTRTDEWEPARDPADPPEAEPGDNGMPIQSNTANFWRLIVAAGASPWMFVCPDAEREPPDMVRPYAPVDEENGEPVAYEALRDFRGELYCHYAFQNVLGPYTLTQSGSEQPSRMAVVADASPLRRDFWSGAPGGVANGATDRHLASEPVFGGEWETELVKRWREGGARPKAWELGSPNHDFQGQNVLFLDGHVEWVPHPYCGVNHDNIWLRRNDVPVATINPEDLSTLRATNDPASYDGTSTLPVDSRNDPFLVP
ncbi:MAG: hypothetical protein R6X20_17040 [Phycisphaerae bacterium]